MPTTAQILAAGTTAATSSDVDVNSTPVVLLAVVTAGRADAGDVLGYVERKDSAGAYKQLVSRTPDEEEVAVVLRGNSNEVTLVAPGTYRVRRPSLVNIGQRYAGSPTVRIDSAISA